MQDKKHPPHVNGRVFECIQKIRNERNVITTYVLKSGNDTIPVSSQGLKEWIRTGRVKVTNLTLTSDNRLVDGAAEKKSNNTAKVKAEKPMEPPKTVNKPKPLKQPVTKPVEKVESYIMTQQDIIDIRRFIQKALETGKITEKTKVTVGDYYSFSTTGFQRFFNMPADPKTKVAALNDNLKIFKLDNMIEIYYKEPDVHMYLPTNCDSLFKEFLVDCKYRLDKLTVDARWNNVITAKYMFASANIKEIVLSGQANKLLDMYKMFNSEDYGEQFTECVSLEYFCAPHVTRTARMFSNPRWIVSGNTPSTFADTLASVDEIKHVTVKTRRKLGLSHVINSVGMIGNSTLNEAELIRNGMSAEKAHMALETKRLLDLGITEQESKLVEKLKLRALSVKNSEKGTGFRTKKKTIANNLKKRASALGTYVNAETLQRLSRVYTFKKVVQCELISRRYKDVPGTLTASQSRFILRVLNTIKPTPELEEMLNAPTPKILSCNNIEGQLGISLYEYGFKPISLKDFIVYPKRYQIDSKKLRVGKHKRSVESTKVRRQSDVVKVKNAVIAYELKNDSRNIIELPYFEINFLGKITGVKFKKVKPREKTIVTRHELLLLLILNPISNNRFADDSCIEWSRPYVNEPSVEISSDDLILNDVPYIAISLRKQRAEEEDATISSLTPSIDRNLRNYCLMWHNNLEDEKIATGRYRLSLNLKDKHNFPAELKNALSSISWKVDSISMLNIAGKPTNGSIEDIFGDTVILVFKDAELKNGLVYIPDTVKYLNTYPNSPNVKTNKEFSYSFHNSVLKTEFKKNKLESLTIVGGRNVIDADYFMYKIKCNKLDIGELNPDLIRQGRNGYYIAWVHEIIGLD